MKTFISDKNVKLDEFLLSSYNGNLSYNRLMKLYREKDVKINGKRINKNVELKKGDVVEVYYDGESRFKSSEINVLYSDENIAICEKPIKISSEDFYALIKERFPDAIYTHRLDTNTSGIIFFALNDKAYAELYDGLKNRDFKKYYYCVVNGVVKSDFVRLTAYLKKDEKNGLVKIFDEQVNGSQKIITDYEVVKRGLNSSLLKVELITGRTHQIRAHLAYFGHFIIGDGKYGNERINRTRHVKGQLLVSAEIIFYFKQNSLLYYLNGKKFSIDYSPLKEELF